MSTKESEDALRRSAAEAYLAEAQRLSHTGSFGWNRLPLPRDAAKSAA